MKLWNEKKCYRVVARSDSGDLFTKKICETCGDQIDEIYTEGKELADLAGEDE